jgi:signal recognition particle subunit SRP54
MGSMKSMLAMLPGAGQMRQQLENFDEKEIDRTEAIIRSMTPAERRQPKLLNGSRRLRIAKGSGMTVTDVNSLVNRFEQAAKMMKTLSKGGVPQMPGMPNMPGIGGFGSAKGKNKDKGKKGSKSGNPAKRAAEEAARLAGGKPAGSSESGAGSAFGLGN